MRKIVFFAFSVLLVLCVVDALVVAQKRTSKPPKRARHPKFDRNKIPKPFFKNLFEEALVGQRPADLGKAPTSSGDNSSSGGGSETTSGFAWSNLISGPTIENEIKAIKMSVDKNITTPSDFAGRGHKVALRDFTMAAVMFAVAGEFDKDVRWKKDAPGVRDMFARAASNTKAGGSIQVYKEAKLRKNDLQDLIGGSSISSAKESERTPNWEKICGRRPLMQRIETAHEKNLQPWVSNEGEFQKNREKILHEAEIIALIGEVLVQEGLEDGDDEDYAAMSASMKQAALTLIDSVKLEQYENASKAVGQIGKSCSQCHESYR